MSNELIVPNYIKSISNIISGKCTILTLSELDTNKMKDNLTGYLPRSIMFSTTENLFLLLYSYKHLLDPKLPVPMHITIEIGKASIRFDYSYSFFHNQRLFSLWSNNMTPIGSYISVLDYINSNFNTIETDFDTVIKILTGNKQDWNSKYAAQFIKYDEEKI